MSLVYAWESLCGAFIIYDLIFLGHSQINFLTICNIVGQLFPTLWYIHFYFLIILFQNKISPCSINLFVHSFVKTTYLLFIYDLFTSYVVWMMQTLWEAVFCDYSSLVSQILNTDWVRKVTGDVDGRFEWPRKKKINKCLSFIYTWVLWMSYFSGL